VPQSRKKLAPLLSDEIFEELESRVINRFYPPGYHLIEDEIAQDLGVSRTPVRDALKALERAGWLEVRPRLGAYVRHTTFEEVRDVFEVRRWIEERAARVAAERITEPQIRTLRKIVERGHKAVERGSGSRSLVSLNTAFHEGLAAASGNVVLVDVLNSIIKQVHRHFAAVAEQRGPDSWSEHEAILDAIVQGKGDEVGRLIVEHSQKTQEAFVRYLSTHHRSPATRSAG
jgi:DNA-binding GntR family transcriptional regulator